MAFISNIYQIFSIYATFFIVIQSMFVGWFMLFYLFHTKYGYLSLIYLIWYVYDLPTGFRGGRRSPFFISLFTKCFLKPFSDYFIMRLHKTVNLDPSKNYIFGYHPHGLVTFLAPIHFCSNSTGFYTHFPGLIGRLVHANFFTYCPLEREVALFCGFIPAEKSSIEYVLTKFGTGNAVVVVIGGAREALDAYPNTMTLTLKERKGFIKLAIKHGASIVPVISFGDNEIYSQLDTKWYRRLQSKIIDLTGILFPLFTGGFLLMPYLPRKIPINTVVGQPIDVVKNSNPSPEIIDELHSRYVKALEDLFDENKAKYALDSNLKLIIK